MPQKPTPFDLDLLAARVAKLSEREAKAKLLAALAQLPAADEILDAPTDGRFEQILFPGDKEKLQELRLDLGDLVHGLEKALKADGQRCREENFKPTKELSYVEDMALCFWDATYDIPLSTLIDLALEINGELKKRTVFAWHPEPTEALFEFFVSIGVSAVKSSSAEELPNVLKVLEAAFDEHLPAEKDEAMAVIREGSAHKEEGVGA